MPGANGHIQNLPKTATGNPDQDQILPGGLPNGGRPGVYLPVDEGIYADSGLTARERENLLFVRNARIDYETIVAGGKRARMIHV